MESERHGYLFDPPLPQGLLSHPDTLVHAGFGAVEMYRDGERLISDHEGKFDLGHYTRIAKWNRGEDPRAALTLRVDGPFSRLTYAFGAEGWYLVECTDGFA